jgi:hypothetical protein
MHAGIGDRSMSKAIFFGNSAAPRPLVKPEVRPGNVHGAALAHFVRDAAHCLPSVLLRIIISWSTNIPITAGNYQVCALNLRVRM